MNPGLTHQQYLEEPAEVVNWFIAFDNMEAKMIADARRRAEAASPRRF